MLSMLVFWNADGDIVGSVAHLVIHGEYGEMLGLADFEAHENSGGRMRDLADHSSAVGSGTWPEWIGGKVLDFKVELHDSPAPARAKITALVHKKSGHRRERVQIEQAIIERTQKAHAAHRKANGSDADVSGVAVDLRDLLGGPDRPLLLDEDGKTKARQKVKPPSLPVIART